VGEFLGGPVVVHPMSEGDMGRHQISNEEGKIFSTATKKIIGPKYLKSFKIWCWKKMETVKWSEKITNEEVLEHIGENRALLNNINHRKANWVGHMLKINWLLHDIIERQTTEVK